MRGNGFKVKQGAEARCEEEIIPSGGSEASGLLPARCGCPHVGGRGWGSVMLMGAAQGWGGGALRGAPFDPSHSPISQMVFLFVSSCEVGGSCSVVPGGQSRGAAQEAGLCDQSGPRLPAPPGAAPRHQERGERRVGPCIAATAMLGSSERCSASWGAQRRLPVHPLLHCRELLGFCAAAGLSYPICGRDSSVLLCCASGAQVPSVAPC